LHQPKPLAFFEFDQGQCFDDLYQSSQVQYIREYLRDLGAQSLIVESNYFDRDYLAEFSSFYSVSSRGYPNICRRLHFFASSVDKEVFRRALGGNQDTLKVLQQSYLGFSVIRPIPIAPLGRTVLALGVAPIKPDRMRLVTGCE
jgi:hypothetical protein